MSLSPEMLADLKNIFGEMDIDKDGLIDYKEFTGYFGAQEEDEEIKTSFAGIDANGDGKINFEEFTQYIVEQEKKRQQEL